MTWSTLGEVRLGQDVLYARDGRDVTLIVDIFQLVDLVGLVDDSVASLEVDEFALAEMI